MWDNTWGINRKTGIPPVTNGDVPENGIPGLVIYHRAIEHGPVEIYRNSGYMMVYPLVMTNG